MTELSDRVKDYLARKKPANPVKVERPVRTESREDWENYEPSDDELSTSWQEFKEAFKAPIFMFKLICTVIIVLFVMWAISVASIQNDCYMNKECREWVKEHR
jgi:hypothetical protein